MNLLKSKNQILCPDCGALVWPSKDTTGELRMLEGGLPEQRWILTTVGNDAEIRCKPVPCYQEHNCEAADNC